MRKVDPTTIVFLGLEQGVLRDVLAGLSQYTAEREWILGQFDPTKTYRRQLVIQLRDSNCQVAVIPHSHRDLVEVAARCCPVVGANLDLTDRGFPSVVVDDAAIGRRAAEYLIARGLRSFGVFGSCLEPFAVRRAAAFRDAVEQAGRAFYGWGAGGRDTVCSHPEWDAGPDAWLKALPAPIGILACCDSWGRHLINRCRILGLRVPEEICVVSVDNLEILCQMSQPSLSSVAIPWRLMGHEIGRLCDRLIRGDRTPTQVAIPPGEVVARASSDTFAVSDPAVNGALRFIHANFARPIGVPDVARKIPVSRRDLERRFRRELGRTILSEIHNARIEMAKRLLSSSDLNMWEIASRCGFADRNSLAIIFKRVTGTTCRDYRRQFRVGAG